MNIVVVGTNHKFSPIELRERISFSRKGIRQALLLLKESPVLQGAVILSTCNRVELYASAENSWAAIEELKDFLFQSLKGLKPLNPQLKLGRSRSRAEGEVTCILPYLYIYEREDAIRHLFSVACGLDSLILGETQILGQLRSAYLEAKSAGFVNEFLQTIFEDAMTFAKIMHQKTEISEGKLSIGSVAIDFIKEKFGSLSGKSILIIGAGKVTELVLKYLKDEKPRVIFISNRTFDKAKELAYKIGQSAVRFDKLPELLKQADVIISATQSPHFIIKKETLSSAISRKLLIVDLAMPRDVDPKVREIENIELFNLEDLSFIVQKNLEKKMLEAGRIEKLINQEAALLWQKLTVLEPEPALLP